MNAPAPDPASAPDPPSVPDPPPAPVAPGDPRAVVTAVAARLAAAGVPDPRVDAELLVAHVLGVARGRLLLAPSVDASRAARLEALVVRRTGREPLQHLLGTAVLGPVEVAVGPGVFVPRPETELLYAWVVDTLVGRDRPLVVDLCTGTGALALAVAATRPDAEVHAVEVDADALGWARRNTAESGVTLHAADVAVPEVLAELHGRTDVVVANPPYVPDATPVPAEVTRDPARAVFAGPDGLAVIRPLAVLAARLCRAGGVLGVEHDESHAAEVRTVLGEAGFTGVVTHADLAGRDRFSTGTRAPS